MEPDFSGYATKAGLKCTDGRTIMKDAFAHQDSMQVPLVWQHGHTEPTNVLGHAVLRAKDGDIYCDGYFNASPGAQAAKEAVLHGDITFLSIFANQLVERSKQVFHGAIREVSLVLAGANPGARIDFVGVQHADGMIVEAEDEAVIHTGLAIEVHEKEEVVAHADTATKDDPTLQEIYNGLDEKEKDLVAFMVGEAVDAALNGEIKHSDTAGGGDETGSGDNAAEGEQTGGGDKAGEGEQTEVEGNQAEDAASGDGNQAGEGDQNDNQAEDTLAHQEGSTDMTRNLFEQNGEVQDGKAGQGASLTHDQLTTILDNAKKPGATLKEAVLQHAAEYGIDDIDFLFPDAKNVTTTPEFISRRMEWVAKVLDGAKHSPFSRIKSTHADITAEEARARGYVKGNLKKDEVIKLLKRVTLPTTVYKKQKLDRDDVVDITDFDVVVWLKGEMRLMLEEELARAILIGDGREPDDEDKIDEDCIRPIAWDAEMYAHPVTVPANVTPEGLVESVLRSRKFYKGTGQPTLFTTDDVLTDMLLIKNKIGNYVYENESALSAKLRVASIVVVEVMEQEADLLGILVNMGDYTIGADRGGALAMFDDFDIDYNQQKYLLETRGSGALTKAKSAVVLKRTSGTTVTPTTPAFNPATNTITIPSVTGVKYFDVTDITGPGEELAAGSVVITETTDVEARANTGYNFPHNTDNDWTFAYTE